MRMHCLKCGGQLPPDVNEPLCEFCKDKMAKDVIAKNPLWAIEVAFEAIVFAVNDLKADVNNLKELQKEIIEEIKQKG
jgi:hypothetical protein